MTRCTTPHCYGRTHGARKCPKCKMRAWRAKYPVKAAYARLKHNARHRGKDFTLTFEEWHKFVHQHDLLEGRNTLPLKDIMTVDRIDPSKGYASDNIRPLTQSENSSLGAKQRFVEGPF